MAHIFALQGVSNSGKSSTLITLLALITAQYPSALIQNLHNDTTDIKVILYPINGLRVGIESQGDPQSRLEDSLADFRNANCDIIFCACRTRGMTVQWINAMSPPDTVNFIPQTGVQAANAAMANRLMQIAGI